MEIKLLFLAFMVMLCVSSTRLIYHDGVIRNIGRLGRHCKMLAVLIVSTVLYAGSLGVEIRQECFNLIEQQEERIRQIVAAKQIKEKADFVLTTSRGSIFEFGDSYGMRTVSGIDGSRSTCDRGNRRGDFAVAEREERPDGNDVGVLDAVLNVLKWDAGSPRFRSDRSHHRNSESF